MTLAVALVVVFAFGRLSVADTALLVVLWCAVRAGTLVLSRRRRHPQPTP
ncbi:hypothetical protein GCM10025868_31180 [Angustibacter aerolatus]|uniref:Uncharacterized protein n=1 Tax=Angustibacter aerolatus TaxID=1162965 RepID=A0ABQ6JI53_9ACTN|nr:hypothetical protein [Angustibacter aerolatus]GMA87868.1 hypothetical protein GCM10025868_31180 [Angustibacter aerolatus]